MIIDFRMRPPWKSILNTVIFATPPPMERPARMGMPPAPSAVKHSVDLLLEEMEAAGVAKSVIMGRKGNAYIGSCDDDEMAEFVSLYPDKFIQFAGVDLMDPKRALKEIERCAHDLGCVGVNIEAGFAPDPKYTDDPNIYPIYAKCEELGLLVSVTLSGLIGPEISYASAQRLQPVLRDFPGVTFILSHGGWPFVQEAVGVAMKFSNLYLCPDMYLNIPNMPGSMAYVEAANYYLKDRMLWGSAYPVRPHKESLEAFIKLPFDDEVPQKVLWDNGARILNLAASD